MKSSKAMRDQKATERRQLIVGRTVLLAAIVVGWELAARAALIDPYFVSRPSKLAHTVAGWFTGQVMKVTGGKANPGLVNEIVARQLAALG